jgi:head-tail adaptor
MGMYPISNAELIQIQNDVAQAACDKDCVIQRATTSSDGYGSQTETYSTINTVKAGMTQPSGGMLQNFAYEIADLAAWQVKFPIGTDVRHRDRLIIESQTLEVHVILDPRSFPGLLTVIAAELK